ncbi:MAG: thioredoxin family protein, partial [Actinomycetota bacterium]|nr:thioredoxin family protein [Actinomycetota bacterium]
VLTGALMLGNYDTRFETAIASDLPAFLVSPTHGLESSTAAERQLAALRGHAAGKGGQAIGLAPARDGAKLPLLGRAPDFTGTGRWFNTPAGQPLTLASLRGRVVLVDFWTYSCVNCIRTLPYLKAWYATYHSQGLEIVGVHSPEFAFEKVASNVASAIQAEGLRYPVVQDNNLATWNAYNNEYWPGEYFIDAHGNVRHAHFGEGDYSNNERVIRSLLAEAGGRTTARTASAQGVITAATNTTPESYLGAARAERFVNGPIRDSSQDFGSPRAPGPDGLSYAGRWSIGKETATSEGGTLSLNFKAQHVYLVTGGTGTRKIHLLLDGRPLPAGDEGPDVHHASVSASSERLYALLSLPSVQRHTLTLEPQPGARLFVFTFG